MDGGRTPELPIPSSSLPRSRPAPRTPHSALLAPRPAPGTWHATGNRRPRIIRGPKRHDRRADPLPPRETLARPRNSCLRGVGHVLVFCVGNGGARAAVCRRRAGSDRAHGGPRRAGVCGGGRCRALATGAPRRALAACARRPRQSRRGPSSGRGRNRRLGVGVVDSAYRPPSNPLARRPPALSPLVVRHLRLGRVPRARAIRAAHSPPRCRTGGGTARGAARRAEGRGDHRPRAGDSPRGTVGRPREERRCRRPVENLGVARQHRRGRRQGRGRSGGGRDSRHRAARLAGDPRRGARRRFRLDQPRGPRGGDEGSRSEDGGSGRGERAIRGRDRPRAGCNARVWLRDGRAARGPREGGRDDARAASRDPAEDEPGRPRGSEDDAARRGRRTERELEGAV
jgi:hypothetical protein